MRTRVARAMCLRRRLLARPDLDSVVRVWLNTSTGNVYALVGDVDAMQGLRRCGCCGNAFYKRYLLVRHIDTVHGHDRLEEGLTYDGNIEFYNRSDGPPRADSPTTKHVAMQRADVCETGYFEPKRTIFEQLESLGLTLSDATREALKYEYIATFDTESLLDRCLQVNENDMPYTDDLLEREIVEPAASRAYKYLAYHRTFMIGVSTDTRSLAHGVSSVCVYAGSRQCRVRERRSAHEDIHMRQGTSASIPVRLCTTFATCRLRGGDSHACQTRTSARAYR